ncbi:MAG: hypothetical protein K9J06_02985 [Flavobacteriales bacterium]|nr:hypothetical protein [Flavobacteriales bacterium]
MSYTIATVTLVLICSLVDIFAPLRTEGLDSYHKHRHRERVRNGIMIALAVLLVIVNLWVYFSKWP